MMPLPPALARLAAALRLPAAIAAVAAVAACQPADLLNALVPDDGYRVEAGTAYGPAPRHRLDIYRPEQALAGPAPIAVYVYGGGWRSGDRQQYRFVGEALASLGFVVIIPDYRLYPEVRFPAFVADVAAAVAWARQHASGFGGDPDRIVLLGHSAGAHIAALLVVDDRYFSAAGVPPDAIRGLVGLAGPYAFEPLDYDSTRPVFEAAQGHATRPIALTAAGGAPPVLLLHGEDDDTVEAVNSVKFATAIRAGGGEAVARVYPDLGHIGLIVSLAAPFRGRDPVFADVADFLARVTAADPPAAAVRTSY